MKMSNKHELYNAMCTGCSTALKQEDIDPDWLYRQWLCGRCRTELEQLPPRHKIVFDRLKDEIKDMVGEVKFLRKKCAVLEKFLIKNGTTPQEVYDDDSLNITKRKGGRRMKIRYECGWCEDSYDNPDDCLNHEKECTENPDVRSCDTCSHHGTDVGGSGRIWYTCRAGLLKSDTWIENFAKMCPKWKHERGEQ